MCYTEILETKISILLYGKGKKGKQEVNQEGEEVKETIASKKSAPFQDGFLVVHPKYYIFLLGNTMADIVTFEDFKKLEIKIGKVVSAEKIPEGDKLLKLIFDVGGAQRQIMAGIAQFFPDPSVLVGKEMPLILNLTPRTLRGYVSEGMMLAAGGLDKVVLLHPAEEVPPGTEVR